MATGTTNDFLDDLDHRIDQHEEKLHQIVSDFSKNVKRKMRNMPRQEAMQCFEFAVFFMTLTFRNLQDAVDAGATAAPSSARASLSSAATTSATASGSPSPAASPRGPPQSLTQRTTFSVGVISDAKTPRISDVKLLPGGLMVLADWINKNVKVFTTLGKHLHSQSFDSWPTSLAVMSTTPAESFDVAVSLPGTCQIALLQVSQFGISLRRYIETSTEYGTIAAVDSNTLAVGYYDDSGIDLMDLSGNVLRQIGSGIIPCHIATSTDHLMVTTSNGSIAKINLHNGSTVFNHKVGQVENPHGITCTPDGSAIVADRYTRTLHLITHDGSWVKQLWSGGDNGDLLRSVSVVDNVCVCCTDWGSVFVLDVSF